MKKKFELYVTASTNDYDAGKISVWDLDVSTMDSMNCVLLSTQEVELDIPEFDIVNIQIDGIDKQIAKIRAAAQMEVNGLEQRKQELLAIGHEVTE
jgi:hypothetical protein